VGGGASTQHQQGRDQGNREPTQEPRQG
jgi:hypothetical protein